MTSIHPQDLDRIAGGSAPAETAPPRRATTEGVEMPTCPAAAPYADS